MAFQIPRLPRSMAIVDPRTGGPTLNFQVWWQSVAEGIEAEIGALAAAEAAEAAAVDAATAASTAQTAADTAQAAAEAAQATADAIVVPPTGQRTITTSDALTPDDYAILADASSGAITLDLPLAAAVINSIFVTKIDATGNAVNIAPIGADDLNGGGAPISITTQYDQRIFVSDGTSAWFA